jgi:hypothetical protein
VLAGRAAERAAEERLQAGWCADPELLAAHLLSATRLEAQAAEHRSAVEFLQRVMDAST